MTFDDFFRHKLCPVLIVALILYGIGFYVAQYFNDQEPPAVVEGATISADGKHLIVQIEGGSRVRVQPMRRWLRWRVEDADGNPVSRWERP